MSAPPLPDTGSKRSLAVRRLGVVPYAEGLRIQEALIAERRAGAAPDTLLLLEHPHVITLGSSAESAHVLADEAERLRLGVEVFEVGRGGGVTYHGPGQLVAYPILDLRPDRKDLHAYLRDLEEVLIRVAGDHGVRAVRREGLTGIWTEKGKLAAVGVRVSSPWITSHGVALNVNPDLSYFDRIVPCGIVGEGVTSLASELGADLSVDSVATVFAERFRDVFDASVL